MELTFLDNIRRLKRVYMQHLSPVCEKWKLTQNELTVLTFLKTQPEYDRAADIVYYCGISKSHVSLSVQHLEKMGLLEKQPDSTDHRTVHLRLTDRSIPICTDAITAQKLFLGRLTDGIGQAEFDLFLDASRRISDKLSQIEL